VHDGFWDPGHPDLTRRLAKVEGSCSDFTQAAWLPHTKPLPVWWTGARDSVGSPSSLQLSS
jgi:hypothetical protein